MWEFYGPATVATGHLHVGADLAALRERQVRGLDIEAQAAADHILGHGPPHPSWARDTIEPPAATRTRRRAPPDAGTPQQYRSPPDNSP